MENLFYDRLKGIVRRVLNTPDSIARGFHVIESGLEGIIDESKIFSVNTAVVESLSAVSARDTDYEAMRFMPFPVVYFELDKTLEILRAPDRKGFVKGILISETSEDAKNARLVTEMNLENSRTVRLFYDEGTYDISMYSLNDILEYQSGDIKTFIADDFPVETSGFLKIFRLTCNLISYINAHNIVLHEQSRGKSKEELARINTRRTKKGHKPILPLKPYYWIEVKQNEIDKDLNLGTGNLLTHREFVRGHFKRYHTSNGIKIYWIDPYVRGPENAPWKNNRYQVLADML